MLASSLCVFGKGLYNGMLQPLSVYRWQLDTKDELVTWSSPGRGNVENKYN